MTAALAYSIRTATEATGLSKSYFLDAIKRGDLKARRSATDEKGDAMPGSKWVILAPDLEAFLASLPAV